MQHKEHADGICGICGKEVPPWNLNLFYCSELCRIKAWKFYHPEEKKLIKRAGVEVMNERTGNVKLAKETI
jgi:hypothetical protein